MPNHKVDIQDRLAAAVTTPTVYAHRMAKSELGVGRAAGQETPHGADRICGVLFLVFPVNEAITSSPLLPR